MTTRTTFTPAVTCLGCGCLCDDITVVVEDARITDTRGTCPLGAAWFARSGAVAGAPSATLAGGASTADDALTAIARRLREARRPLVLLAPDVTTEAHREAVGLADEARALIDTGASPGARALTLAMQERGRVAATFAEIRRRADLVVWWGCDPDDTHPRFRERCVAGTPESGHERVTIALDIGERMGPADAGLRIAIPDAQATTFATAVRATLQGADVPGDGAAVLAGHLAAARYALVVVDADGPVVSLTATSALLALVSSLNDQTRAALVALRAGGNGTGADAVLTWQAGAPLAVDFASGVPTYVPHDGARERLARGDIDLALVVGRASALDPALLARLRTVPHALIGPDAVATARATPSCLAAIGSGVAGIHESGTAMRMDEVPLALRAPLAPTAGAPTTVEWLRALRERRRA